MGVEKTGESFTAPMHICALEAKLAAEISLMVKRTGKEPITAEISDDSSM